MQVYALKCFKQNVFFPPKDFVQVGYVSCKIITGWHRKKKYNQIKEACTPHHRCGLYCRCDGPQNRGISGTGKGRSKKFASQNSMEGYQSYSLKYDLLVYDFLSWRSNWNVKQSRKTSLFTLCKLGSISIADLFPFSSP